MKNSDRRSYHFGNGGRQHGGNPRTRYYLCIFEGSGEKRLRRNYGGSEGVHNPSRTRSHRRSTFTCCSAAGAAMCDDPAFSTRPAPLPSGPSRRARRSKLPILRTHMRNEKRRFAIDSRPIKSATALLPSPPLTPHHLDPPPFFS